MKFNNILSNIQEPLNFSEEDSHRLLHNLVGEDMSNYDLIDSREVNDENQSVEDWMKGVVEMEYIKQDANAQSNLDKNEFKVRYSYTEKHSSTNSRQFCREMMGRTNNGVVYRYDDIIQASMAGINNKFGHKGRNYNLFKFKGGPYCNHVWTENLYRLKRKANGEFVDDKGLTSSEEIKSADSWYTPKPAGYKESRVAPTDMPRHGHHPNFNLKM